MSTGFLDPSTSGVYATCARKHEKQAIQELGLLFEEKVEEIYGDELKDDDDDVENKTDKENEQGLSIEDKIQRELQVLREKKTGVDQNGEKKKEVLQFIDLNCECVIFCKTRKPVVPEKFVKQVIKGLADPSHMEKRTRYIQKLTPITSSCSASKEQLIKLAERVLAPHFHNGTDQPGLKFAVEVTRRNFNTMERLDVIKQVVSCVVQDGKYNHQVDLKNYDKLVLVECFKSNIGMSVVDADYTKEYRKYNVQQIYEKKLKDRADK